MPAHLFRVFKLPWDSLLGSLLKPVWSPLAEVREDLGYKVPQSNFLMTVIINLVLSFFLSIFAILLKFVCHPESVRQRNHLFGHKNDNKTPFLWLTNDSFVALTQCDKLVLRKWQKQNKKGDMVKIENHCIKKIWLGHLL